MLKPLIIFHKRKKSLKIKSFLLNEIKIKKIRK